MMQGRKERGTGRDDGDSTPAAAATSEAATPEAKPAETTAATDAAPASDSDS